MYIAIVVWFAVVAGFFYLLIWRPQLRRMAAVRSLQAELREGDDVVTTSGIYGVVRALGDDHVLLEITPTTVIKVARGAIGQRVAPDAPGEPGGNEGAA